MNVSKPMTAREGGRSLLLAAAGCSLAIALLHAVMPLLGPDAYRFFGGFNMAALVESGAALRAALITESLALIFAIWGVYALSGAGMVRRLPLLRLGLLVIGGIYSLRGLMFVPEIIARSQGTMREPEYFLWFSVVSLIIGILCLVGTRRSWDALR